MKKSIPHQNSSEGFAVPLVLAFLVLISIAALYAVQSARAVAVDVRHARTSLVAASVTKAAIMLAVADLEARDLDANPLPAGPRIDRIDGLDVSVSVADAASRIDINGSDPRLLENLIAHVTGNAALARALNRNAIQWRERAGAFETVATLRSVSGFDAKLVNELSPFLTVYNKSGAIALRTAATPVLLAIPGFKSLGVRALAEGGTAEEIALAVAKTSDRFVSTDFGNTYIITAWISETGRFASEAVIGRDLRHPKHFAILRWIDGPQEGNAIPRAELPA
jgi:hypothetical protein